MSQGQTRGPGGAFSAQQLRSGRLLNLIAQKPELPENRNRRVPVSAPVATCSFSPLPCSSLFTFSAHSHNQQPTGGGRTPGAAQLLCRGAEQLATSLGCLFCVSFLVFLQASLLPLFARNTTFLFLRVSAHATTICPECSFPSSCLPPNPGRIGA